jgi:hypothetical protein
MEIEWEPHDRLSDPTTVSADAEDGLASRDRIKIKAPDAGPCRVPNKLDRSQTPQRQY